MANDKNYQYILKIAGPIFILGLIGIGNMIYNSAYIWLISTFIFWILFSGLGIAVGYHRIYSHKGYKLKKWLDFIILLCGSLACQSSSITWVATHIGYHHPFSDTDKDPHTPCKGKLYSLIWWTTDINEKTINHKYSASLLRNPLHVFFHRHYTTIVWSSILVIGLINWQLLWYGYFIAAMLALLQDNCVNMFCHLDKCGYRNFDTKDNSKNVLFLGYFAWGQGWHNNHHKFPNRFNYGVKWWEFDPCVIFIPLLKFGSE